MSRIPLAVQVDSFSIMPIQQSTEFPDAVTDDFELDDYSAREPKFVIAKSSAKLKQIIDFSHQFVYGGSARVCFESVVHRWLQKVPGFVLRELSELNSSLWFTTGKAAKRPSENPLTFDCLPESQAVEGGERP